jgi:hypothetical protein
VILPISSANLSEMTPADGAFRRNLGLTMLQLSRGWQLRNPVHVRGMELRALFAGEEPVASNVFTLAPGVLFIGETPLAPPPPRDPIAALGQRISEVFAIYQVAVEDEKIPNPEGLEKAEAWARWSGISETEIKVWLEEKLDDGVSKMPLLGTLHRTVYDRVRNAEAKWEANHFNDIQFLSCAAAYADIVVGEKETSEHLKRAQRGHWGAAICRTFPEAIACLTDRAEAA